MKTGLLWFDNDPKRTLAEKIAPAAKRYHRKFGAQPNICYVHKSSLPASACATADRCATADPPACQRQARAGRGGNGNTAQVGQILVTSQPASLLHHFWIGQEDQP